MSLIKSIMAVRFNMSRAIPAFLVSICLLGCSLSSSALKGESPRALSAGSNAGQTTTGKAKGKKGKPKHYMKATLPDYKNYVFMLEDGTRLTPKEVEMIPAEKMKNFSVLKDVAAEVCMTEAEKKAGKTHVIKIALKE